MTSSGGASSGSGSTEGAGGSEPSGGSGPEASGGSTSVGGSLGTGGAATTGGDSGTEALAALASSTIQHVLLHYSVFEDSPVDLQRLLPRPGAEEPPGCNWMYAGDCRYTEGCEYTTGPNPDLGNITLSSSDVAGSATSSFSDGAYGFVGVGFSPRLGGGENLQLNAAGGVDLPAFEVEATFPLLVLVDSPSGDASQPISVPSSSDLTIAFRRATGGVLLNASSRNPGNPEHRFDCAAAGDPGTLVIPQAVLEWVGTGAQIGLFTWSATPFQAGDEELSFAVATDATTDAREHSLRLVVE